METKISQTEVWRIGIQGNAKTGYSWFWSPEFASFDELISKYHDWLIANPMRRIQFRKETKYVPQ